MAIRQRSTGRLAMSRCATTRWTQLRILAALAAVVMSGGLALGAQAAPHSSASSPHWKLQTVNPPATTAATDLVYDPVDHLMGLIVGADFWTTRDGRVWTSRPGPTDVVTNLVYDAARQQLVAFAA